MQLRDIYNAESQIASALPEMANAAHNHKLQNAFEHHLQQTKEQMSRLEKIFDAMGESPEGETCEAMQGLIDEGQEIMHKDGDPQVKDAALIAAAQRIEHYEISAYGTVLAYAERLNEDTAQELLQKTLDEEKHTDEQLTDLAVHSVNPTSGNGTHTGNTQRNTVIGLYDSFEKARDAIESLDNEGIRREQLSLVAGDKDERYANYLRHMDSDDLTDDDDPDAEEGAGFGAVVGTLTGLGAAIIPGIGGFVVAGAAGAALFAGIGAATGAATGGLTAGLVDMGVDEDDAEAYEEQLRKGGAMVIVHVPEEREDEIESILHRHDPVDVEDL
jgi:ferritin-like metal-binding protein YciE